ncbi:hypothetical protein Pla110_30260 [Polystyrenella longa]|uniref:Uncharacterized protein n=1 Tax=Polystyrenella longa TaxID=2528007 RepID=A0A518CPY6_9PLAN|nr:hypothetical protein Pla110_30260 [Polystyrenella longa]
MKVEYSGRSTVGELSRQAGPVVKHAGHDYKAAHFFWLIQSAAFRYWE